MTKKPLIYLAGPFTHENPVKQHERGKTHCKTAVRLLNQGHLIYSPIAETMNLAEYGEMINTTWETWREKDLDQINRCDEMWVMMLEGWDISKGVRGEIKWCLQNNKPVYLLDLDTLHCFSVPQKCLLTQLKVSMVEELND